MTVIEKNPERADAVVVADEFSEIKEIEGPSNPDNKEPTGGGQPEGGDGTAPVVVPEPAAETPAVPAKPEDTDPSPANPDPEKPAASAAPETPETPETPVAGSNEEPVVPAEDIVVPETGQFTQEEEPLAVDPSVTPEVNEQRYEALSERTGFDISNDDDIVALVEDLGKVDPLEGVSPLLKKAIDIEKGGGDVKQFLSILRVNVEGLDPKKALFEKYLNSNPDLAKDEAYAKEKFDRDYDMKYGILANEKLDVDFENDGEYAQYLKDREFAKKELEWNGNAAKAELQGKQDELLTEAHVPVQDNTPSEEAQQMQTQYVEDAAAFMEDFETIQIPIDKEGKSHFSVPMNSESRPLLAEWSKTPSKFFDYIGVPSDGKSINAEALNSHMAMTAMLAVGGEKGFGYIFANAMTERINSGTIEHELVNPAPTDKPSGTPEAAPAQSEFEEGIGALANLVAGK